MLLQGSIDFSCSVISCAHGLVPGEPGAEVDVRHGDNSAELHALIHRAWLSDVLPLRPTFCSNHLSAVNQRTSAVLSGDHTPQIENWRPETGAAKLASCGRKSRKLRGLKGRWIVSTQTSMQC